MSEQTPIPSSEGAAFWSDGLQLAADLYLPSGPGPHPAVVMCHGFGGLREFWLPDFAAHFNGRGYAALAFDHRGTGGSEGPRGRLIPYEQVSDIRHALAWLEDRSDIDADKLVLYGISYGGANAVYAAALDRRVAAVACAVGYGNGTRWLKALRREWEWIEFRERLHKDRKRRARTGESELVDTSEVLIRDPEAEEHEALARAMHPDRMTSVTLDTADAILGFCPEAVVGCIAPRPSLFIGVADDTLVPTSETLALHAAARQPKRLKMFPPIGHHGVYYGDYLTEMLDTVCKFFDDYLGAP
jgi:pimeloyl-ACP methyl ester carboxylesterase